MRFVFNFIVLLLIFSTGVILSLYPKYSQLVGLVHLFISVLIIGYYTVLGMSNEVIKQINSSERVDNSQRDLPTTLTTPY